MGTISIQVLSFLPFWQPQSINRPPIYRSTFYLLGPLSPYPKSLTAFTITNSTLSSWISIPDDKNTTFPNTPAISAPATIIAKYMFYFMFFTVARLKPIA